MLSQRRRNTMKKDAKFLKYTVPSLNHFFRTIHMMSHEIRQDGYSAKYLKERKYVYWKWEN